MKSKTLLATATRHLKIRRHHLYNGRMAGLIPYFKLGKADYRLEGFTINPKNNEQAPVVSQPHIF